MDVQINIIGMDESGNTFILNTDSIIEAIEYLEQIDKICK